MIIGIVQIYMTSSVFKSVLSLYPHVTFLLDNRDTLGVRKESLASSLHLVRLHGRMLT